MDETLEEPPVLSRTIDPRKLTQEQIVLLALSRPEGSWVCSGMLSIDEWPGRLPDFTYSSSTSTWVVWRTGGGSKSGTLQEVVKMFYEALHGEPARSD